MVTIGIDAHKRTWLAACATAKATNPRATNSASLAESGTVPIGPVRKVGAQMTGAASAPTTCANLQ